jgi:hypothetical protein
VKQLGKATVCNKPHHSYETSKNTQNKDACIQKTISDVYNIQDNQLTECAVMKPKKGISINGSWVKTGKCRRQALCTFLLDASLLLVWTVELQPVAVHNVDTTFTYPSSTISNAGGHMLVNPEL